MENVRLNWINAKYVILQKYAWINNHQQGAIFQKLGYYPEKVFVSCLNIWIKTFIIIIMTNHSITLNKL